MLRGTEGHLTTGRSPKKSCKPPYIKEPDFHLLTLTDVSLESSRYCALRHAQLSSCTIRLHGGHRHILVTSLSTMPPSIVLQSQEPTGLVSNQCLFTSARLSSEWLGRSLCPYLYLTRRRELQEKEPGCSTAGCELCSSWHADVSVRCAVSILRFFNEICGGCHPGF